MLISLNKVEPFNIPPVDNDEAALFMKHLTGNETFEFSGDKRPLCMMIYDLKYSYPNHSYAHGWLLSISLDELIEISNLGAYPTMESIIKKYILGTIGIEFGGNFAEPNIYTKAISN